MLNIKANIRKRPKKLLNTRIIVSLAGYPTAGKIFTRIMDFSSNSIRILFGLKLRQLRLDKALTQYELADLSGVSVSYINEIEKGKKYPKTEKIIALASAMGVTYETLVSVQLSKKMEPIYELLRSNILRDLPLAVFGIEPADLLELLANAPTKLSAFISTIMEIGRQYNLGVEEFYFAVLRTYVEMHENYFADIEQAADAFLADVSPDPTSQLTAELLSQYLHERHGYVIELFDDQTHPNLNSLRSVMLPAEKKLLLNKTLTTDQRAFTLGREVGFLWLDSKERPLTSSWVEVRSFDQVLTNFRASYFSGAILMRKDRVLPLMENWLSLPTWAEAAVALEHMLDQLQATPETLLHRMSNFLPHYFGIDQLFFLRFEHHPGDAHFDLTKEMHLARLHSPHGITGEHYCRRWVSLSILKELADQQQHSLVEKPLLRAQISTYIDSQNAYFIFGLARPLTPIRHLNHSVSLGILLNETSRKRINFLNDPAINRRDVNESCERCRAVDCLERSAPPLLLHKRERVQALKGALQDLGVR
jgi:XRE family transcriptional regulator, fatty acid utilization regulator